MRGRVLLLNASYEPLGTIGLARAIRLMFREENPVSVIVKVEGEVLTSAGGRTYDKPSVVVLRNYVDNRKFRRPSGSANKRARIYIRDGYRCGYSKQFEAKFLTLDHIVPKSKGGSGESINLVTACKPCNTRKKDRTPEQARMPLLTTIHDIKDIGVDEILICQYAESRPEWKPFLFGQQGMDALMNGTDN